MVKKVQFYQVQGATPGEVDAVLPSLLERILGQGGRAVVHCPTAERCERVSNFLWSFTPTSFLPHGIMGEAEAPHHPIWVSDQAKNPNKATFLLSLGGALGREPDFAALEGYDRILDVFDAGEAQVATARSRWKAWTAQEGMGEVLSYYALTEQGWVQKA